MPANKNKNTKHRTSTRHPSVCCRWSEKEKRWIWGYRIVLADGESSRDIHIHDFDTYEQAENCVSGLKRKSKDERHGIRPIITRPLLRELVAKHLKNLKGRDEFSRANRVLNYWLAILSKQEIKSNEIEDLKAIGQFCQLRVDETDSLHLQAYIDQRTADGVQPPSIDREENIIVACLNAARIHYKELRQWRLPPIPRMKFSKASNKRVITADVYKKLVTHLYQDPSPTEQEQSWKARLRVGRILRFMNLTGCRSKDAFALRLDQIEWDFQRIKMCSKTDQVRYVPISEDCAEILRDQISENARSRKTYFEKNSPYVFTLGGNGTPKIYRVLKDACEAVGVKYGKSENGLTFYWSRHTYVTALLHAGADAKTAGAIVGHTDQTMTLYYSHVTPESMANVQSKLREIEQKRLATE